MITKELMEELMCHSPEDNVNVVLYKDGEFYDLEIYCVEGKDTVDIMVLEVEEWKARRLLLKIRSKALLYWIIITWTLKLNT